MSYGQYFSGGAAAIKNDFIVSRRYAPESPVHPSRLRVTLYRKRREASRCCPNARRSKYSIRPAPALAVQEPSASWSSIGEHHCRRSTDETIPFLLRASG